MDENDNPLLPWPFKLIHLDRPLEGLDEEFEHDRERYVLPACEQILGYAGRLISLSKSGYTRQHSDHAVVFNANVCTSEDGKIWFGDLDLTLDEPKLAALAHTLAKTIYVLRERDGRFQGRDDNPQIQRAVLSISADGRATTDKSLARGTDGRLHAR